MNEWTFRIWEESFVLFLVLFEFVLQKTFLQNSIRFIVFEIEM